MRTSQILVLVALSLASSTVSRSADIGRPATNGENVLFSDDFSHDPLGAAPRFWTTTNGSFSVTARDSEQWLSLNGAKGEVEMDVPGALPERWTLDFDLLQEYAGDTGIALLGIDAQGRETWSLTLGQYGGTTSTLDSFESHSSAVLADGNNFRGRHHVSLAVNGGEILAQVDTQRLNVKPVIKDGPAASIRLRLTQPSALVSDVRLAGIDAAKGQALRVN